MVRINADGSVSVGMLADEKESVESVEKTDSVVTETPKKTAKKSQK